MTLSTDVFLSVLLAALCHACWNAVVKIGADRLVVLTVVNLVGAMLSLLVVPFVVFPQPAAWPWLFASFVLHQGYYYFLIQQYRVGDLSHVYPLSRGLSPLLVAIGAALLADEFLSLNGILGMGLASFGVLSLALERGPPWKGDSRPVRYAVCTAFVIASYTVVDGIGVRNAGSTLGYIAWLFLLDGLPLTIFTVIRRGPELFSIVVCEWRKSLFGGALSLLAYGLVIWAMSQGSMAQVSAIRETSVIFAALIGVVLLKERCGVRRVVAAILVASGLIVLNTS
ncbi:MAG: drug/metabolite transporter (DMT)-like permease [Gammaproteobacteria bacterium]